MACRIALVGGLFIPVARPGVVLRHAMTAVVKKAEVAHAGRFALVGGLFIPLARLGGVLRHAMTVGVKQPRLAMAAASPLSAAFSYHSRALA